MSKNERAFAINAPPDVIWRTLLDEVRAGVESGRAQVVHEEAPRGLVLDVRMGWGLGVRYDYRLSVQAAHTEVAVTVAPHGLRYALANIISFGRGSSPYMLAVTQGLANLKEVAEAQVGGRPSDDGAKGTPESSR
ncbi:MAG: hypothetical protein V3V06_01815 [Dehalococcoidia bacterium]